MIGRAGKWGRDLEVTCSLMHRLWLQKLKVVTSHCSYHIMQLYFCAWGGNFKVGELQNSDFFTVTAKDHGN